MKTVKYKVKGKLFTRTKKCNAYNLTVSPQDSSCCVLTFLGQSTGKDENGETFAVIGVVFGVTEYRELQAND